MPAIDAHRDGDDLVAAIDLPGIDPENDVAVELSNSGRTLTVSQDAISATYDAGGLTVRVAEIYAEEQLRKIRNTSGAGAEQVPAGEESRKLDA